VKLVKGRQSADGSNISNNITYFLGAGDRRVRGLLWMHRARSRTSCGDGRDGVSGMFCSYLARPHTTCGQVSQRDVLQRSSKITYSLWAGNGRQSVGCCAAIESTLHWATGTVGLLLESFCSPSGVQLECTRSPLGVHQEFTRSPTGVQLEHIRSSPGVQLECISSPTGVR
jgi:hypothetical protein